MEQVLARARMAAPAGDSRGIARCNTEFHELILQASENSSLVELLEPIRNKAIICRLSSMQYQTNVEVSLREHAEIIRCLESGRATDVGQLLRHHITTSGRRLLEQVGMSGNEADQPILRYYQLSSENGGLL
ncbi:MAG: FCD domain-containing protein [Firmicutes bacterium]|nr:FCD domain-containing protein [Bacillota bacterium]